MERKIAILVYKPYKKKRKDESFDGNDNIGILVVKSILERAGFDVGYCSVDSANQNDIVLVSLTSTFDVYSFYKSVAKNAPWKKRQFKVVCGGFGLQNPYPIRNYIDYGVFGRCEGFIADFIKSIADGDPFDHESIMVLPDVTPVKIAQADKCLDFGVEYNHGKEFIESFIGCPNKCKFCHYTWSRKSIGHHGEYVNETLSGSSSPEMTWKQLMKTTGKLGRVRSAIDGLSERLRYLFGKKISNGDIIEGIERLGGYGGNTVCVTYNIGNFPTETRDDLAEFADVVSMAKPKDRVIIVLHTTPFRPSLATPMQWEPVSIFPNWNKYAAVQIYDSPKLRVVHSTGNEAPYSHLMCVIAERATGATDRLFHNICFNPKLQTGRSSDLARMVMDNFDTDQYLKQYEIGQIDFPGAFLSGYLDVGGVAKKMRKIMR
jgi:radical SAM superfamily enzyme YgiQ (UPF0313 family)